MPKNHQEHLSSDSEWQPGRHRLARDVTPRTERDVTIPRTESRQVSREDRVVPRYIPHYSRHEGPALYEDAQRSPRHTSDRPYGIQRSSRHLSDHPYGIRTSPWHPSDYAYGIQRNPWNPSDYAYGMHYTLESTSLRGNSQVLARQVLDMNIPTFDDTDIPPFRRAYSKEYLGELRRIAVRLLWQWLPIRFKGARFNIFAYFGIRERANTDTQSSSRGTGSRCNTTSYAPGWQTRPRQRVSKRAAKDSDEEGGDEGSGSRRLQRAKLNIDGKYWACPYWKHDPLKYSLRNDCKCATYLLDSIPRLKQHLYRIHTPPRFYCTRCFDEFESQDLLHEHSRQEDPCRPQANKFTDSITPLQFDALKKRTPKKTPRECWENIYQILFPDDPLPDSPYVEEETPMHIELDDLREYVFKEAPELIEHIDSGLYRRLGVKSEDLLETIQDIIQTTVDQYISLVARKAQEKRKDTSQYTSKVSIWTPSDFVFDPYTTPAASSINAQHLPFMQLPDMLVGDFPAATVSNEMQELSYGLPEYDPDLHDGFGSDPTFDLNQIQPSIFNTT